MEPCRHFAKRVNAGFYFNVIVGKKRNSRQGKTKESMKFAQMP